MDLKSRIRTIADFPKPGIQFKDITPLLADPEAFSFATQKLAEPFKGKVNLITGMESRGFIFAGAMANILGVGFVPIRKLGKLPYKVHSVQYDLEYGSNTLEIHQDAISKSSKVLIIDDLLATGGTAMAAKKLIEKMHGKVEAFAFLIELDFLKGRQNLGSTTVHSLIHY